MDGLGGSFDVRFIKESMTDFVKSVVDSSSRQRVEMKTDTEFSRFSLKDAVRLVAMMQGDAASEETTDIRDRVARQLLVKVGVDFYQDGKKIGSLARLTDQGQSLEADQFLQENPLFYQLVLDTTTGYVLKNFTAPPKPTPETESA